MDSVISEKCDQYCVVGMSVENDSMLNRIKERSVSYSVIVCLFVCLEIISSSCHVYKQQWRRTLLLTDG